MVCGKFLFLLAVPLYTLLHLTTQTVPIAPTCGNKRVNQTYGKGLSRCVECPVCPPGQGASVECGTTASESVFIGCVPCTPGVSFSKHHDHSTCQYCGICVHEVVKQRCTNSTQIVCGDCEKGYYRASTARACKRCSVCCNDGTDIKVPKCLHDGLPSNVQCEMRHAECQTATISERSSTPKPDDTTPRSPTENVSRLKNSLKPTQTWLDEAGNSNNNENKHDANTTKRSYPSSIRILVALTGTFSVAAIVVGWMRCRRGKQHKIGIQPRLLLGDDGVELIELNEMRGTGYVEQVSTTREDTTSQITDCAEDTHRETGLQSTAVQTGGSLGDLLAVADNLDSRSLHGLTEEQKLALRISKLPHTFVKDVICMKLNIVRIDSNDFRKLGEIIGAKRVYIDGLEGNPKITDPAFKLITEKCAELTVRQFLSIMRQMEREDVVTEVKNFLQL